MTITLDLEYEDAEQLRAQVQMNAAEYADAQGIAAQLGNQIQDEAGRRYDQQQERLMEDGGPDDSAYRRDMVDAGRGHLLR